MAVVIHITINACKSLICLMTSWINTIKRIIIMNKQVNKTTVWMHEQTVQ